MGKGGIDLLRGTLDMLVLQVLRQGPSHGYAIARTIQRLTDDVLNVEEGSLYPALYRLEKRGWIVSEWGMTDTNRRAKLYTLTDEGWACLETEVDTWGRFTDAVAKILESA